MWNWLNAFRTGNKLTVPTRWLAPSENPWGLPVLDCSQNACSMMSTTSDVEIAMVERWIKEGVAKLVLFCNSVGI
jgi:hypothetical protein